MKSKTEKTGRRIVWETRIYSPEERRELRRDYLEKAAEWLPPEDYFVPKYLLPGDAGYDTATEEEIIIWHSDADFKRKVPNENYTKKRSEI